jgi:hypothetical protein
VVEGWKGGRRGGVAGRPIDAKPCSFLSFSLQAEKKKKQELKAKKKAGKGGEKEDKDQEEDISKILESILVRDCTL